MTALYIVRSIGLVLRLIIAYYKVRIEKILHILHLLLLFNKHYGKHFRVAIVLSGIDGSGKTTQSKLLMLYHTRMGLKIKYCWARQPYLITYAFLALIKVLSTSTKSSKDVLVNVFHHLFGITLILDLVIYLFVRRLKKIFSFDVMIYDRFILDIIVDYLKLLEHSRKRIERFLLKLFLSIYYKFIQRNVVNIVLTLNRNDIKTRRPCEDDKVLIFKDILYKYFAKIFCLPIINTSKCSRGCTCYRILQYIRLSFFKLKKDVINWQSNYHDTIKYFVFIKNVNRRLKIKLMWEFIKLSPHALIRSFRYIHPHYSNVIRNSGDEIVYNKIKLLSFLRYILLKAKLRAIYIGISGSVSKMRYTVFSDIDLVIIVPEKNRRCIRIIETLERFLKRRYVINVSIEVYDVKDIIEGIKSLDPHIVNLLMFSLPLAKSSCIYRLRDLLGSIKIYRFIEWNPLLKTTMYAIT